MTNSGFVLVPYDRCQQNLWRCDCAGSTYTDPDRHSSDCPYVTWFKREESKERAASTNGSK